MAMVALFCVSPIFYFNENTSDPDDVWSCRCPLDLAAPTRARAPAARRHSAFSIFPLSFDRPKVHV